MLSKLFKLKRIIELRLMIKSLIKELKIVDLDAGYKEDCIIDLADYQEELNLLINEGKVTA